MLHPTHALEASFLGFPCMGVDLGEGVVTYQCLSIHPSHLKPGWPLFCRQIQEHLPGKMPHHELPQAVRIIVAAAVRLCAPASCPTA